MPYVFTSKLCTITVWLISHPNEGRRLSCPWWLVTYQDKDNLAQASRLDAK